MKDRVIILCIGIGVITVIIPCITFSGPTHLVVILRDFFEITTVHCFGLACAHFLTQKNFHHHGICWRCPVSWNVISFKPLDGWCFRWLYYFGSLYEGEPLLANIPKIANHQHQAATNHWLMNVLFFSRGLQTDCFIILLSQERLAICASIARQSLTRPFGKSKWILDLPSLKLT